MDKTIPIAELQKDMEHILDEVATAHIPYVLMRNDQPAVVLIPYDEYTKLLSRQEIIARFNKTWAEIGKKNARFSNEEIEADLELIDKEELQARSNK